MRNVLQRGVYLVVLLFLTISVGAQSSTSRITGTVTDSTGSAVEGAKITLINEATRVPLTQITGSGGVYAFTSLTAGTYTIEVEQRGLRNLSEQAMFWK